MRRRRQPMACPLITPLHRCACANARNAASPACFVRKDVTSAPIAAIQSVRRYPVRSGKEIALLRSPPLRTVRASCPAHGSSLRGGEEIPGRTEHPILVSPYRRLSTPVLRSVQLALSNVSVG